MNNESAIAAGGQLDSRRTSGQDLGQDAHRQQDVLSNQKIVKQVNHLSIIDGNSRPPAGPTESHPDQPGAGHEDEQLWQDLIEAHKGEVDRGSKP